MNKELVISSGGLYFDVSVLMVSSWLVATWALKKLKSERFAGMFAVCPAGCFPEAMTQNQALKWEQSCGEKGEGKT